MKDADGTDRPAVCVDTLDYDGAEYPETRVEFYECDLCHHEFRKVLTA